MGVVAKSLRSRIAAMEALASEAHHDDRYAVLCIEIYDSYAILIDHTRRDFIKNYPTLVKSQISSDEIEKRHEQEVASLLYLAKQWLSEASNNVDFTNFSTKTNLYFKKISIQNTKEKTINEDIAIWEQFTKYLKFSIDRNCRDSCGEKITACNLLIEKLLEKSPFIEPVRATKALEIVSIAEKIIHAPPPCVAQLHYHKSQSLFLLDDNRKRNIADALDAITLAEETFKVYNLKTEKEICQIDRQIMIDAFCNYNEEESHSIVKSNSKIVDRALQYIRKNGDDHLRIRSLQKAIIYFLENQNTSRTRNLTRALELAKILESFPRPLDNYTAHKNFELIGDVYASQIQGKHSEHMDKAAEYYSLVLNHYEDRKSFIAAKIFNRLRIKYGIIQSSYGEIEKIELGQAHIQAGIIDSAKDLDYSENIFLAQIGLAETYHNNFSGYKNKNIDHSIELMKNISFSLEPEFTYRKAHQANILFTKSVIENLSEEGHEKNLQLLVARTEELNVDAYPYEMIGYCLLIAAHLKEIYPVSFEVPYNYYEKAYKIAKKYKIYKKISEISYHIMSLAVFLPNQEHRKTREKHLLEIARYKSYSEDKNIILKANLQYGRYFFEIGSFDLATLLYEDVYSELSQHKPRQREYLLRIVRDPDHSADCSIVTALSEGDVKKALERIETLKYSRSAEQMHYERYLDENNQERFYFLYLYRWFAEGMINNRDGDSKFAGISVDQVSEISLTKFFERYNIPTYNIDIVECLADLQSWVFIPIITQFVTKFILIPPKSSLSDVIVEDGPSDNLVRMLSIFANPSTGWANAFKQFSEATTDRADDNFEQCIDELSFKLNKLFGQWLFGKIRKYGISPDDSLVIIPYSIMAVLPLGLTLMDERTNQHLIDCVSLSYAQSLSSLRGLEYRARNSNHRGVCLFTAPDEEVDFSSMESILISKLFEHSEVSRAKLEILEDSTSAFREALSREYWHIQLHGHHDLRHPENSALKVPLSDEYLKVKELFRISNNSLKRVITMSSCESGIVDFNSDLHTLNSFPTAMTLLGAAGVVSSLWVVNSDLSCLLMICFYENHLLHGLSPPQALRKAQIWVRSASISDIQNYLLTRCKSDQKAISFVSEYMDALCEYYPEQSSIPFEAPIYWAAFNYYGV